MSATVCACCPAEALPGRDLCAGCVAKLPPNTPVPVPPPDCCPTCGWPMTMDARGRSVYLHAARLKWGWKLVNGRWWVPCEAAHATFAGADDSLAVACAGAATGRDCGGTGLVEPGGCGCA